MGNTLGYYNPYFYANEALIQLEKVLGMAGRVHRGYDEERRSFGKGEYINIRRPSTFTAQNAPSSAQNVATGSVQLQLAYWREVKFELTDKELSFTSERIIDEHIRPAAYALADDIDQKLAALYKDVPWYHDLNADASIDTTDITDVREVLFDNKVPLRDIGRIHYMIDGTLENKFLGLTAFSQQQGAGDRGVMTQMTGSLGTKFGMEIFANQNTPTHTAGTCADATGALTANASAGATSIAVDSVTSGGTVKAGDTLVIAGNTQRYAITADATFTGGSGTLSITPALVTDYSTSDVVTIRIDSHVANLAFHRNAFALATAPLTTIGNELGAKIASVTDPITGLALRSRLFYEPNDSAVNVALDILYGVKTLDPNLAARGCGEV